MSNRRAFIGAAGVAVFTALLLPIMFGQAPAVDGRKGGDAWRNWIFDFQTLITGLAAVSAAAATISVMEKTDARQEARHRELVELSLRSEKLKVERALYPQVSELQSILKAFEDDAKKPAVNRDSISFASETMRTLKELLGRPHFIEGASYFPGSLNNSFYDLTKLISDHEGNIRYAYAYIVDEQPTHEADWEFSEWEDNGGRDRISAFLAQTKDLIGTILRELGDLRSRYGIDS